jgi:hypothetical protein
MGDGVSHLVLLGSPVGGILRSGVMSASRRPPANKRVVDAGTRARRFLDPDCDVPACGCPFPEDLTAPLAKSTRVISIFSRDDPIVPASACRITGGRNFEVRGTHSGLAYNVGVYQVLSDVLAG